MRGRPIHPAAAGSTAVRATMLLGSVLLVAAPAGRAQPPTSPSDGCTTCHTCDTPTKENPCVRPCTRTIQEDIARAFHERRGPDVVLLGELEERYLPVPFDHKGHAEMAEMTIGCAVCHHYTPEGAAHPACKTCHEISPARENIRRPGLKGAYHRQCLNCHREWSHETSCRICHLPKTSGSSEGAQSVPTRDDIVGMMHPPIPEPDTELYRTERRRDNGTGTQVLFRHREHIHRFGLACVECHHEDNCMRCHEEGKQHVQRKRTLEEHHTPCAECHDMLDPDGCRRCHWSEGQPKPAPFDHATTSWPLGRFHESVACRDCHTDVPFVALDRSCNSCHREWGPQTFDHGITGQILDETHREFDCEECHADRSFDRPPVCSECHEEDEGIRFPDRRPGPKNANPKGEAAND